MIQPTPNYITWLFLIGISFLVSCDTTYEVEEAIQNSLPEVVDFNYHIKPILSDRCFKCHGPDNNARKANLRLDLPESALNQKLITGGYAFVPKRLKKSQAFQRMIHHDADLVMPPPESNLTLTTAEIAMVAKWIKQGAKYKEHWSFIPPKKADLPKVENKEWVSNEIDYFILNKLEEQGLQPAEKATKNTLLRRASFDLTGLPPSVEMIDEFVENSVETAYELAIDSLLASPHYGERLGVDWLDLARYADTHGYQDDGKRNVAPWRDWVIKAFNENLPYNEFVLWQLAGDLLPNPTQDQLIATCFNRNHPQTQEGGIVDEEYRVEYVADRTNTFGKAFLGLTIECARCHDHKYDPILQKDYYSMYAYFNNNNESGIVPYNGEASPTLILPSDAAMKKLKVLNNEIDSLSNLMLSENYVADFEEWLANLEPNEIKESVGLKADFSFEREEETFASKLNLNNDPNIRQRKDTTYAHFNAAKGKLDAHIWGDKDSRPKLVEGIEGKGIEMQGDCGLRFNKDIDFDRNHPFSVSLWVKLLKEGEAGPIFNKTNGDFEGYRGWLCKLNEDGTLSFQLNHVWPDNAIDIQTTERLKVGVWTHLIMTYDGSSKADGVRIFMNGKVPQQKLWRDNLHKSLLHGVEKTNWSYLPVMLGMELRKSIEGIVMDEFQVYDRQLSNLEIRQLYQRKKVTETTIKANNKKEELVAYYLLNRYNEKYNQLLQKITAVRAQENRLMTDQPEVMIMNERAGVRSTYILDRGAYDAPMEEVQPDVPAVLPKSDKDLPKNRLGLAQWLIDEKNPLTARVAVNRLWTMCFGRGLVETQEDFGNQGNLPIHPELLDWLAADFMENGWDMKYMLKKIMLSSTYQQSSVPSEKAKLKDLENLYYSHYPIYRLSAEMIRDNALTASGLLVRKIGGESVYPYQPEGIWEALATRNETKYRQQSGDSLYRRSLYTVWKRSSPPPSMLNFDAPDRYYCVVRRQKTSTPLQSLVLMNDPQYVEAARVLAQKVLKNEQLDLKEKINYAFKALTSRSAKLQELKKLLELYETELAIFKQRKQRTRQWLSSGEYPIDKALNRNELAAMTVVTSTMMNFEEFIIKR